MYEPDSGITAPAVTAALRAFWAAVAAGVVEIAIVVSTFVPGAPFLPFAAVLAVLTVTALALAVTLSMFKFHDITGVWVFGVVILILVVAPVSVSTAATAFADLPGQPEVQDGRYYFNDHGHQIRTTRAGYERGLAAEQRLFAGISIGLSAVAALGSAAIVASRQPTL